MKLLVKLTTVGIEEHFKKYPTSWWVKKIHVGSRPTAEAGPVHREISTPETPVNSVCPRQRLNLSRKCHTLPIFTCVNQLTRGVHCGRETKASRAPLV